VNHAYQPSRRGAQPQRRRTEMQASRRVAAASLPQFSAALTLSGVAVKRRLARPARTSVVCFMHFAR
jgi:hypothetical protein